MPDPSILDQIWGLAQLAGEPKVEVPGTVLRREMLVVKLVSDALRKGVTWAEVGRVLVGKPDGKAAKKLIKRLAHDSQHELLRRDINA